MTLGNRLQVAIRDLHTRIEELPLAQAMADGSITRGDYGALMAQMLYVHEVLEAVLPSQAKLAGLYHTGLARAGDIREDISALGLHCELGTLLPATRQFGHTIAATWANNPAALAGCLYVLEGSRMGSMVLAPRLARAFGVGVALGQGLDYHVRDMERRPVMWRAFKANLESLPLDADTMVSAAEATMAALYAIYEAVGAAVPEEVLA